MTTESAAAATGQKKTPWAFAVATFFGAGYGKPGPGTWGSVAAVLLWAVYAWGAHPTPQTLLVALIAGVVLAIAAGVPAAVRPAQPQSAGTARRCRTRGGRAVRLRAGGLPVSAVIVHLPTDVGRFHAGMAAVRERAATMGVSSQTLRGALQILLAEMLAGRSSGAAVALANSSMRPYRWHDEQGGAA